MDTVNFYTIIKNISLVASILFFFFSFTQLLYQNKQPFNYFLSIIFFATGYQFLTRLLSPGMHFDIGFLALTNHSFLFLVGPCIYFYFTYITFLPSLSIKKLVFHSFPFFISLILILIINIFHPSFLNWSINSTLFFLEQTGNVYISFVMELSYLSLFFYFILTFKKLYFFFLEKEKSLEIKILLLYLVLLILFSVILVIAHIYSSDLVLISYGAFSFLPLFFIFFTVRYPEFSMRIIKESKTIHYKHNIKSEQRDSLIIERLFGLMKDEKLYKDEGLNLNTLSSSLFVTAHELSRILNVHFQQNFNVFINNYRINEARRLFMENPEMSILHVVYETGFRTKSSFYQNFLKITGISPGEFKKNVPDL